MRHGSQEFEEIANCGGTGTFTIRTSEDGRRSYQVRFSRRRPVPMVLIGIYALPQGIPVDCASCGARNDLADLEGETVPAIRNQSNNGTAPEDCLRSAISAFDSVVAQFAKELVRLVP